MPFPSNKFLLACNHWPTLKLLPMYVFILCLPSKLLLSANIHLLLNIIFSFVHVAWTPVTLSNRFPTNSLSWYFFSECTLKNISAFHFYLQIAKQYQLVILIITHLWKKVLFLSTAVKCNRNVTLSQVILSSFMSHDSVNWHMLCFWIRSGVTNLKKKKHLYRSKYKWL